ncbi:IS21 family transposase [Bifidobacterium sp.]|uniref:IS21 family transposase n=1 Tax=Bifidobacterium sp. TaxID=41200 RepID=UPI00386D64CD
MGELNTYRQLGVKPNFTQIGRKYGLNRHTVAKYWNSGEEVEDRRRDKPSRFDEFREEIERKAELPGVTKKAIHEFLLDRHEGSNIPGYNAFTQYCRTRGIECASAGEPEAHPRFETPPGRQLQFDWKESLRMADRNGEVFEFNVFAATLCWSRRHVFIYSRTKGADDLVRCMYLTIARLGGVPAEWLTDNMSALVVIQGGKRHRVARVFEFAEDAGFEIKMCKVRSPQTKGKVESSNRFLSRLMAYQGDFEGEEELVGIIARIEERCNAETNETTGMPPSALFMDEKEALRPVGNMRMLQEAMGDVVDVPKVDPTMLVSAHGRKVSVPRRCIGRPVRLVCMPEGGIDCYMSGKLVASHGPGQRGYSPEHYREAMEGKRWFGDGDIEAAAAANLELLSAIGGRL